MVLIHMPYKSFYYTFKSSVFFTSLQCLSSENVSIVSSQALRKILWDLFFAAIQHIIPHVHTHKINKTTKSNPPPKTQLTNQRNQGLQFICLCYVEKHQVLHSAENPTPQKLRTCSSLTAKFTNTSVFTHQSVSCQILVKMHKHENVYSFS